MTTRSDLITAKSILWDARVWNKITPRDALNWVCGFDAARFQSAYDRLAAAGIEAIAPTHAATLRAFDTAIMEE